MINGLCPRCNEKININEALKVECDVLLIKSEFIVCPHCNEVSILMEDKNGNYFIIATPNDLDNSDYSVTLKENFYINLAKGKIKGNLSLANETAINSFAVTNSLLNSMKQAISDEDNDIEDDNIEDFCHTMDTLLNDKAYEYEDEYEDENVKEDEYEDEDEESLIDLVKESGAILTVTNKESLLTLPVSDLEENDIIDILRLYKMTK